MEHLGHATSTTERSRNPSSILSPSPFFFEVADRVLDPMSPEFMWQLSRCNIFEVRPHDEASRWVKMVNCLQFW